MLLVQDHFAQSRPLREKPQPTSLGSPNRSQTVSGAGGARPDVGRVCTLSRAAYRKIRVSSTRHVQHLRGRMKNQTSARILSSVLAASCWLGQQSWAQAAARNPASQATATSGSVQVGNNSQAQDETAGESSATQAASAQQSAASSQAGGTSSPSPATPQPVHNYP